MKNVRNTPTAFRFTPSVKEALAVISERDGRSRANMLEWLIKKHCEKEGLGWPPISDQVKSAKPLANEAEKSAKKSASRTSKK